MAAVTVLIVSWNTRDLLSRCIESVRATTHADEVRVMVIDNGSTDGSVEMLNRRFADVEVVANPDNLGFARANNLGAARSDTPFLLLLNSDAQLSENALESMMAVADRQPRAGVVGASVYFPDGRFQASFAPFPGLLQELLILSGLGRLLHGAGYPSRPPDSGAAARRVDWVNGACLLVRRQAFLETGGFDASFFLYAEEVDLCFTLRQRGWETWYAPEARVFHVGGASSAGRALEREAQLYRSRVRFFRKHYGRRSAAILSAMILLVTALKLPVHRLARSLSRGRIGRPVVPLRRLARELREP